jgi:hypothetical protein
MKYTASSIVALLAFSAIAPLEIFASDSSAPASLQSRREPGQTDKVTTLLEVSGEFKELEKGKEKRVEMRGVDKLSYHEKILDATPGRLRSVRYYEKADSLVKFKDGEHAPSLGESHRRVGVAIDLPSVTLYSLQDPLTRDELEVIDILGNSLLLDSLLPKDPVSAGQSWKPDDNAMAAFLGLDKAKKCDVQCTLKEITDAVARFEVAGTVEGPDNDTEARIEIKGKYRLDLKTRRIDWFAMLMKEDRGISQAAAGFEITVRFQMIVAPEKPVDELAQDKLDGLDLEPKPESTRLAYQSPKDHWRFLYDRRWYLNSDDRQVALLKLIDQGSLLGICKVTTLPRREPDKLVSLKEFQDDVREALKNNFDQYVVAGQSVNQESKTRVFRVVAEGKTEKTPTRWVFYHIADQLGRQVTLTFTVDQENVEKFADADKPIVESLRFPESGEDGKAKGDGGEVKGEGREAKGEGREGGRRG